MLKMNSKVPQKFRNCRVLDRFSGSCGTTCRDPEANRVPFERSLIDLHFRFYLDLIRPLLDFLWVKNDLGTFGPVKCNKSRLKKSTSFPYMEVDDHRRTGISTTRQGASFETKAS